MPDTDTTQDEPEIAIVPIPTVDYDWFGPADDDNPISRLVDDRIDYHEYNGLGRIANLIQ